MTMSHTETDPKTDPKTNPEADSEADPKGPSKTHRADWCTPSRRTGRNQYSLHLRNINTLLYRVNKAKLSTSSVKPSVTSSSTIDLKDARTAKRVMIAVFDRIVLKLTKREEAKFVELLRCFADSPEFNSYELIMRFSRTQYILDRGIVSDVAMLNKAE